MSLGNTVLQLFCFTLHGAYIVSFSVEPLLLLLLLLLFLMYSKLSLRMPCITESEDGQREVQGEFI